MFTKMGDEITNPFPNFNSATIEVWEWICYVIPALCNVLNYLFMLGLKLILVGKRDPKT